MRITIIYNQDNSGDAVVDDSIKTAQAIAQNLATLGHQTDLFELKSNKLPKFSADVLFNQAWGVGSDENSEDKVAQLLEKTGISYTGADAKAIRLTGDKIKTKKLLKYANISTPRFQIIKNLRFPLIVKPSQEDCSLGISQSSIYNEPILIEEYIDGRELNVTILGHEVLPISEITFGPTFKNKYKIVDFAAKWEKRTPEYKQTVGVCPAKLPASLSRKIQSLALKVFKLTHGRDLTRIDFRLSSDGTPFVLEVNVNPAIGPEDGAVRSARAGGLSYPKFLEKIVKLAYGRHYQTQIS